MILFTNFLSLTVAGLSAVFGLIFVYLLSRRILKADSGSLRMQEISESIYKGAMAFLRREYRSIAVFVFLLAILIFLTVAPQTAFAFIAGAAFSLTSGFIGMKISTRSNVRTAQSASRSFNSALGIAFSSGAVTGTAVVSLGLLGIVLVYFLLIGIMGQAHSDLLVVLRTVTQFIVGFSLGASSVALFARVGGGIYTKAADVGADLVGKVESNIPEDDPRNPAVIADNVGDNVGDVAGMGADLFESYVGAIISALVIAATTQPFNYSGFTLVLLLSAWGLISSVLGVFFVRVGEKADAQSALNRGMLMSALFFLIGSFLLCNYGYGGIGFFYAVLAGLISGAVIGFVAQYYTSGRQVKELAESAKTGPATCIIQGTALAMHSTILPLVAIALATIIAFKFAGMFGIALAAIGMLALTGMTVAVDAYGPVADNAAGIAEMAGMGKEVRERAEHLDAVGNTTAAIGKGFAIGSAALTALALFAAYAQSSGLSLIDALDANVVAGIFIGGVAPFIFCSITLRAVGRAAFKIVEEVRRQFREIAGLMEGKVMPDSTRCVDITTKAALKEMIIPGIMAVILPLLMGVILGTEALGGFLVGSLVTGVPLALFLANAGGAWDNAKKYVESGNLGGKGSDVHKATVIGDTVGDPFKDTAGPSLNILLKLMAVVSLVFSPAIISLHQLLIKFFALFG